MDPLYSKTFRIQGSIMVNFPQTRRQRSSYTKKTKDNLRGHYSNLVSRYLEPIQLISYFKFMTIVMPFDDRVSTYCVLVYG